jgi:hypothetical protein
MTMTDRLRLRLRLAASRPTAVAASDLLSSYPSSGFISAGVGGKLVVTGVQENSHDAGLIHSLCDQVRILATKSVGSY